MRIRREGALRSRAARGDAAAFALVYERHHQALYRYCRSILRHEEDAQDALQNTMARAFAALQTEQRDFELRPWLFRIAHNEAISILRRRRQTGELDDQAAPGDLEERVADREELRLLQLDLADLPERQRAALVLRELNGLSHAEIAVVLDISTGAVKQSIFEARSALFSCREGREMACDDVRRMLSDGDGRVLRGRGVRAHLRSCPDCRRFRTDIERRPHELRALFGPLPLGTAATLLAQITGGGTAAKLLACIAIAGGGGATLAVEAQHLRPPAPAAAQSAPYRPVAEQLPGPSATAARITPVLATAPQRTTIHKPATSTNTNTTASVPRREAKPDEDKTVTPKRHGHVTAPGQAKKDATAPGQAKQAEDEPTAPPGQAKKENEATKVPPGEGKRETKSSDKTAKVPPVESKKPDTPPGEEKRPATPPGEENKPETPPGEENKPETQASQARQHAVEPVKPAAPELPDVTPEKTPRPENQAK